MTKSTSSSTLTMVSTMATQPQTLWPAIFNCILRHVLDERRVILVVLASTLGSMGLGMALGFTSPAIPDMNNSSNKFRLSSIQVAFVVSSGSIGRFLGSLLGGYLLDKVGRKASIMYLALPFVIGWVLIAASRNSYMLVFGRLVVGLCGGVVDVAVPVYIAEMSPPNVRGAMCSCHSLCINFGILFVFVLGIVLHWQWLAIAAASVPVAMICLMIFIPESPSWLLKNRMKEEAVLALQWIRICKDSTVIASEISSIEATINVSHETFRLRELLQDRSLRHRMAIVIVLLVLCMFSGAAVIPQYTVSIFSSARSTWNPYEETAMAGSASVIANLISAFLLDRVGRRLMLLMATGITALSLASLASYFTAIDLVQSATPSLVQVQWIPIVSLIFYNIGNSSGFVSVPFCLASEMFPLRARGLLVGIGISSFGLSAFAWSFIFPILLDVIGHFGVYWILTGSAVLAFVFTAAFVPETKGKTLDDIESMFK